MPGAMFQVTLVLLNELGCGSGHTMFLAVAAAVAAAVTAVTAADATGSAPIILVIWEQC